MASYIRLVLTVAFFSFFVTHIVAAPNERAIEEDEDLKAMETEGMFQGDIVPEVRPRFHIKREERKWPNGIVRFSIDTEIEKYRPEIEYALWTIERSTCIRFEEYTEPWFPSLWEQVNYVKYVNETGCWSLLGMRGGMQKISLGPGCRNQRNIVHETMHALGFGHMHCNKNRDKYIRVHWDNIKPNHTHNFDILDPFWYEMSVFDFSSIMLYHSFSFSKNGNMTMQPRSGGYLVHNQQLSNNDIYYINKVYDCKRSNLRLLETHETE